MGSMVGLPFFFWLVFTLFDFGNIDQLFALMAVIGLILCTKTLNSPRTFKNILFEVLIFILLCSPLIRKMSFVPIELFNYLAFIIPFSTFVLLYIISLFIKIRNKFKPRKQELIQRSLYYSDYYR